MMGQQQHFLMNQYINTIMQILIGQYHQAQEKSHKNYSAFSISKRQSYHLLYLFSLQKYYNKMDNEDNADKLSEARSSRDQQTNSAASRIVRGMCACFMPCLFSIKKQNIIENQETPYQKGPLDASEYRYSKKEQSIMSQNSSYVPWENKKNNFLIKSVYEHANRLLQDYDESLDKSTIKKWHSYSIYEYRENELLAMGTSKGRILCKITCSRVEASATAKKKTNQSRSYERPSDRFTYNNVDKYWNKRYLLFERFDQGISLDDESWYSVTPEAVAEHIAGKIRCDTVLDGFCGAGGNAIKLSNTCSRVICNDISGIKLKLLQKNAKVYCVQNIEMLNEDFLEIEGFEPDIVFLAPPFGSQQNLMSNSIQPNELNPALQKIFSKAIRMSKNIVMLLPPNINVHRLGQIIATSYINSGIVSSTCSIKIQKIFFMSQLKYMAVYIGSMIQTQINLNDQLCYIYNYLKEGEKKIFKHKKVVRFLREKYGMIRLLNYVFQLDKVQKSGTLIEKLYELIIQNNLIQEDKLARLIRQQNQQEQAYKRKKFPLMTELQSMEEQKYMGEETDKEATLSYYSENSANKLARDSKMSQSIQARKSARSAVSSVIDKQGIELQQIPRSNTLHEATGNQQISSNIFKSSQIRISRSQNQNE